MAMTAARRAGPVADINVTPMADIMIVLLIIFMVATPLLSTDPRLRLPDAQHGHDGKAEELTVVLDRSGQLTVGAAALAEPELPAHLASLLPARPDALRLVRIKADQGLPYERVERVLELCKQAGAEQMVLMTASVPR